MRDSVVVIRLEEECGLYRCVKTAREQISLQNGHQYQPEYIWKKKKLELLALRVIVKATRVSGGGGVGGHIHRDGAIERE